jgi:hypothetical protein
VEPLLGVQGHAGIALERLDPLDPRSVWRHEAHDFTPWLLANSDALAEILGIELELSASEHPVGGFALDLVGRDLTNNCVLIVENQLAGTDQQFYRTCSRREVLATHPGHFW